MESNPFKGILFIPEFFVNQSDPVPAIIENGFGPAFPFPTLTVGTTYTPTQ